MAFALASGAHSGKETAKGGARIILAPPFYQFLVSTLVEICNYYRSCLVKGRTGK